MSDKQQQKSKTKQKQKHPEETPSIQQNQSNSKVLEVSQQDLYEFLQKHNCQTYKYKKNEEYPNIRPPVSRCSAQRTAMLLADAAEECGCPRTQFNPITDIVEIWKRYPYKNSLSYYGVGSGVVSPEANLFNKAVSESLNKAVPKRAVANKLILPKVSVRRFPTGPCGNLFLNRRVLKSKLQNMPTVQRKLNPKDAFTWLHCPRRVRNVYPFAKSSPIVPLERSLDMEHPVAKPKHGLRRRHMYCELQCGLSENPCTDFEWRKHLEDPRIQELAFSEELARMETVVEPEPRDYDELYEELITCFEDNITDPFCTAFKKCCVPKVRSSEPGKEGGGRGPGGPGGKRPGPGKKIGGNDEDDTVSQGQGDGQGGKDGKGAGGGAGGGTGGGTGGGAGGGKGGGTDGGTGGKPGKTGGGDGESTGDEGGGGGGGGGGRGGGGKKADKSKGGKDDKDGKGGKVGKDDTGGKAGKDGKGGKDGKDVKDFDIGKEGNDGKGGIDIKDGKGGKSNKGGKVGQGGPSNNMDFDDVIDNGSGTDRIVTDKTSQPKLKNTEKQEEPTTQETPSTKPPKKTKRKSSHGLLKGFKDARKKKEEPPKKVENECESGNICSCEICHFMNRQDVEEDSALIREMKFQNKRQQLRDYYKIMCHREYIKCQKPEYRSPQHKCDSIECDIFCNNPKLGTCCECLSAINQLMRLKGLKRKVLCRLETLYEKTSRCFNECF